MCICNIETEVELHGKMLLLTFENSEEDVLYIQTVWGVGDKFNEKLK